MAPLWSPQSLLGPQGLLQQPAADSFGKDVFYAQRADINTCHLPVLSYVWKGFKRGHWGDFSRNLRLLVVGTWNLKWLPPVGRQDPQWEE